MKRLATVVVGLMIVIALGSYTGWRLLSDEVRSEDASVVTSTQLDADSTVMGPTIPLEPDRGGGSTAAQQVGPRSWFVSPSGSDSATGTESSPMASVAAAAAAAAPGDSVVLMPGTHGRVTLDGINGTDDDPIRIVGQPGAAVSAGTIHNYAAFLVKNSSHLEVAGIRVHDGLYGVLVERSNNIKLSDMITEDVGQTGIKVQLFSHHVVIERAVVQRTGRKTSLPYTGEGIYLGSGGRDGDTVHDVQILDSQISETTAEAIDIKPHVYNVVIDGNFIHDIDTFNSGAVVVGIGNKVYDDPSVVIRNNTIARVRATRSPYADANCIAISAAATVYNNVLYDCADRGILINSDFPNANARQVNIWFNTVVANGRLGDIVDNGVANTDISNNIGSNVPGNIATDLSLFVDPAALDFSLRPGAVAAIDQGTALGEVAFDHEGAGRQSGSAPDLGAIELLQVASTSSTTTPVSTTQVPASSTSTTGVSTTSTQFANAATSTTLEFASQNQGGPSTTASVSTTSPANAESTPSVAAVPRDIAPATTAPASQEAEVNSSATSGLDAALAGEDDSSAEDSFSLAPEVERTLEEVAGLDRNALGADGPNSSDRETPGGLEADAGSDADQSRPEPIAASNAPGVDGRDEADADRGQPNVDAAGSSDQRTAPENLALVEVGWEGEEGQSALPLNLIVIAFAVLVACAVKSHSLRSRRDLSP